MSLSASDSTDTDGTIRSYSWTQTGGQEVTLDGAATATASFDAPLADDELVLEFEVAVTDDDGAIATARVAVTIHPNVAPRLDTHFPCDGCRFFGSQIAVSGVVDAGADNEFVAALDGVSRVTVDAGSGPVAALVQANGRWLARDVPVNPAEQSVTIKVVAEDSFQESSTATIALKHEPTLTSIMVAPDVTTPDLFYLVEQNNLIHRVFSLDLSTGMFRKIYEADGERDGFFAEIQSVLPHPDGSRLLLNTYFFGILSLDIGSGALSVVSDRSNESGPVPYASMFAALDGDDNRIFVYDPYSKFLIAVDIATGDRTVISDNSGAGTGPAFSRVSSLAVDSVADIAYLWASWDVLFSVALSNGTRAVLPRSGERIICPVTSMLHDANRSRVVAATFWYDPDCTVGIYTVDIATGYRQLLSGGRSFGGLGSGGARELVYDQLLDRYVINDFSESNWLADSDRLIAVDPDSGARAVLYNDTLGGGPSVDGSASTFAVDWSKGIAYLGSTVTDSIISIDLRSGDRETVSSIGVGSGLPVGSIRALEFDPVRNQLLMVDGLHATLNLVDVATGDRTILSGNLVGGGPEFALPSEVALDVSTDTAFVLDRGARAVVMVEMSTGHRKILSDDRTAGIPFREPRGMVLDADNGKLLVGDNGTGATDTVHLFSVDLDSGSRQVISDILTGNGDNLTWIADVEIIPESDLAIVSTGRMLVLVNVQSGNRIPLASNSEGFGESISGLGAIAFDAGRNTIYGWNGSFEALFVFSAETGDRVVLSK